MFGSGRKDGHVELGDFVTAPVQESAGLDNRLLLRKMAGCWGQMDDIRSFNFR